MALRHGLIAASIVLALPAHAATTALQCGDLFDAAKGALVGPQTVVIDDGRITSVQPGKVAVEGAAVIDLTGHTCSPGWIDLHVQVGQEFNPQSYSEGSWLADVDFALRDAINAGTIPGPRIDAAGTSIATTGGVLSYARSPMRRSSLSKKSAKACAA